MRLPSVKRLLNPGRLIGGMTNQALGVILFAATNKFIPWPIARWGAFLVFSGMGMWYPITQATLNATLLDQKIEQTF